MNPENEKYMLFFSGIEGLGAARFEKITERFGSPEGVFKASDEELSEAMKGADYALSQILEKRKSYDIEGEYARIGEMCLKYYSKDHEEYPKRLKLINDPPLGLFVKGSLPKDDRPAIAIVGSRACSEYGRAMSIRFGRELGALGIDIISGMAAGVDGYAHSGALEGQGLTYAVLGCGAEMCYPRTNGKLYMQIQEKGGIISEYCPGTAPVAINFPRRNRIISALSDGILVVEAREKSGSLITVDMGLEQGKDIYALPGRIGDVLSLGCNKIIRQGARLITEPADIIAELAPKYGFLVDRAGQGDNCVTGAGRTMGFSPNLTAVYNTLSFEPVSPSDIAAKTGLDGAEVLGALSLLEIQGHVRNAGNGCYVTEEKQLAQ